MRILVDGCKIRTGGVIQLSLSILRHMATDRRHEWHVVASSKIDHELDKGYIPNFASYRVLPIGKNILSRYWKPQSYMPAVEQEVKPDLVFSLYGPVFWRPKARHVVGFVFPWAIYPDSPVHGMLNLKEWLYIKLLIRMTRKDYQKAHSIMVETETVRQRVHRYLQIPLERIHVIPIGCSPYFTENIGKVPSNAPADKYSIVVPSAYYVHKNLELLPRAAAELKKLLQRPFEFVFTIPDDLEGWQRILKIAHQLNVQDTIRTVGFRKHIEMPQLYRSAHVVCLPTLLESSTSVYPEAFMAKIPVTTSDLDFTREVCDDAALFFDPASPQDTARVLAEALTNMALRTELASRGEQVLKKNYLTADEKWNAQVETLEKVAKAP